MHDFGPAAGEVGRLMGGIRDDQLSVATPCEEYTLGDLLDHVRRLSLGFNLAATKTPMPPDASPTGDAGELGDDWRTRIPAQLDALAEAWRADDAWQGMTRIAGIDLPGDVAGLVALNEVVVHGWDIAPSTGQPYDPDPESVSVCLEFVSQSPPAEPDDPAFGVPVDVPEDAAPLDRLVGRNGRSPAWPAT